MTLRDSLPAGASFLDASSGATVLGSAVSWFRLLFAASSTVTETVRVIVTSGSKRSTSKSAVSREFVSRTRENLIDLMSRPLCDLRLAVVMLDGIELKGRCCVVALGIDTDGAKHALGLWDGSTENATVATASTYTAWVSKLVASTSAFHLHGGGVRPTPSAAEA